MDKSRFDLDKILGLATDISPSYHLLSETGRLLCLDLLTRTQERWQWRYEDELLSDAQWDEALNLVDLAIEQLIKQMSSLDELDDVTIIEPGDNNLLVYDDEAEQWINRTASEAGLATADHGHDHGDLDGLADDDHSQYLTEARLAAIQGFFHASRSSNIQSINDSTDTVLTYDNEILDSEGWLNAGTGKLLPNRACTMMLSAGLCINTLGAGKYCVIKIKKNGSSVYSQGISIHQAAAQEAEYASASAVVSFNGTTDYVEVTGWHNHGSARDVLGYGPYTWFCGSVIAI